MFGIVTAEVFAPMVFCKECRQKVEDCPHFVDPIFAPRVNVHDEKIQSLAYAEDRRILEISYKTGQVWQLFSVPPTIYQEIRDTSLWSFVKFIAQRYKAAPVKTGIKTIKVPESEPCASCRKNMVASRRIDNTLDVKVRVFWECPACGQKTFRDYTPKLIRS